MNEKNRPPAHPPLPAQLIAPEESIGMRLDTWISRRPGSPSRNRIQQLIKDGLVTIDGHPVKASHVIEGGEVVDIIWPDAEDSWPFPQDLPINIIHDDEDLIIVNKQHNMIVHPSAGHPDGTLVNALIHRYPNLPGINGVKRPGIVHRLDRDTTGLLVVAKNDRAMTSLTRQLADRAMSRRYVAVILGDPEWEETTVDAAVGRDPVNRLKRAIDGPFSKPARSHFRVLCRSGQFTMIECKLESGRTHQIRIHARHINHPIICDELYDGHVQRCIERFGNRQFELKRALLHYNRPFLHAYSLAFHHPGLDREVTYEAPLPPDSATLARMIFGERDHPIWQKVVPPG